MSSTNEIMTTERMKKVISNLMLVANADDIPEFDREAIKAIWKLINRGFTVIGGEEKKNG